MQARKGFRRGLWLAGVGVLCCWQGGAVAEEGLAAVGQSRAMGDASGTVEVAQARAGVPRAADAAQASTGANGAAGAAQASTGGSDANGVAHLATDANDVAGAVQPAVDARGVAGESDAKAAANVAQATTDARFGIAMSAAQLDAHRGGDALIGQNDLTGSLTNTSANRVVTGSNSISQGSFSNASGLPTVIQNSGANVLIQNATVLNVRFGD